MTWSTVSLHSYLLKLLPAKLQQLKVQTLGFRPRLTLGRHHRACLMHRQPLQRHLGQTFPQRGQNGRSQEVTLMLSRRAKGKAKASSPGSWNATVVLGIATRRDCAQLLPVLQASPVRSHAATARANGTTAANARARAAASTNSRALSSLERAKARMAAAKDGARASETKAARAAAKDGAKAKARASTASTTSTGSPTGINSPIGPSLRRAPRHHSSRPRRSSLSSPGWLQQPHPRAFLGLPGRVLLSGLRAA